MFVMVESSNQRGRRAISVFNNCKFLLPVSKQTATVLNYCNYYNRQIIRNANAIKYFSLASDLLFQTQKPKALVTLTVEIGR